MLVTNQRLDKLAAAHNDFASRGMLNNSCLAAELKTLGKFNSLLIFICAQWHALT